MPSSKPADRYVLATAVVDSLVVAADPDARRASVVYWEQGRRWTEAVVEAVKTTQDPAIRSLGVSLLDEPADPVRYANLRSALLDRDGKEPSAAAIFDLAWQAECNSRIGYHLGPLHETDAAPVPADELRGLSPGSPSAGHLAADVLVVVPFRDNTGGMRLRNLLACLLGLRDQSFPRERYQVTVVESDDVARWKDAIAPFADHYLFAAKPGAFNKSWAVNVGARHVFDPLAPAAISPTEICCAWTRPLPHGQSGNGCTGARPAPTPTGCVVSCSAARQAAACGCGPGHSTASVAWMSATRDGEARTTTSPTVSTLPLLSTPTMTRCYICTIRLHRCSPTRESRSTRTSQRSAGARASPSAAWTGSSRLRTAA